MFTLKRLSPAAVRGALEKALRYRMLNEPAEAESICRDILEIAPQDREAVVTLLLSLTDQFSRGLRELKTEALEIASRLPDAYDRAYYTGVVHERHAKAHLRSNAPGCGPIVYAGLRQAMAWFEKAEAIRPEGNDDALLRYNHCVRLLRDNPKANPEDDTSQPPLMLE